MSIPPIRTLARRLAGWRECGALPEPIDPRDRPISAAGLPTTPPPERLPRHGLPPLYQAGNSCTGRAVHGVRIALKLRDRDPGELSGLHNYRLSRILAGLADWDMGSYNREAVRAIAKFGCAPASMWPEVYANVQRNPPPTVQRAAHKLSGVRGYYRLSNDLDEWRRVLASDHAIVAAFYLAKPFMSSSGSETVDVGELDRNGPGHALVIDGYDRSRFHSPASWRGWRGTRFVEAGCWFTERAIVEHARDSWALIFDPEAS